MGSERSVRHMGEINSNIQAASTPFQSPNTVSSLGSSGYGRATFSNVMKDTVRMLSELADPTTGDITVGDTKYKKDSLGATSAMSVRFDINNVLVNFIMKTLEFETKLYQNIGSISSK